jgi:hypothetical protein
MSLARRAVENRFCRVLGLDNFPRFVMIAESAVTFLPDRKFVL